MKKIFAIVLLVAVLSALAPGQAQAAKCVCKGTLLALVYSLFGYHVVCGFGSTGGDLGKEDNNLTDKEVTETYINSYQLAISYYNAGQEGYDLWKSGWSCHK